MKFAIFCLVASLASTCVQIGSNAGSISRTRSRSPQRTGEVERPRVILENTYSKSLGFNNPQDTLYKHYTPYNPQDFRKFLDDMRQYQKPTAIGSPYIRLKERNGDLSTSSSRPKNSVNKQPDIHVNRFGNSVIGRNSSKGGRHVIEEDYWSRWN